MSSADKLGRYFVDCWKLWLCEVCPLLWHEFPVSGLESTYCFFAPSGDFGGHADLWTTKIDASVGSTNLGAIVQDEATLLPHIEEFSPLFG